MLGKKRAREEEGLHEDDSILQYQNRCLLNDIKQIKEEQAFYKEKVDLLTNQYSNLSKVFMEINCRILNISEFTSAYFHMTGIPQETLNSLSTSDSNYKSNNNFILWGISILKDIKDNFQNRSTLIEENSSMLDNVKNNIENIFNKVLSCIEQSKNIKSSNSTNLLDCNTNNNNISSTVNSLSYKIESFQNIIKNLKESSLTNIDISHFKSSIVEKDKLIERLKEQNTSLKRRLACNPTVPYIKFSNEFYKDNEKPQHECWCYFCGKEYDLIYQEKVNEITLKLEDYKKESTLASYICNKNCCLLNNNDNKDNSTIAANNITDNNSNYNSINNKSNNLNQNKHHYNQVYPNSNSNNFQPNVIIINNQSSSNIIQKGKNNEVDVLELEEQNKILKSKLSKTIREKDDMLKRIEKSNIIDMLESEDFKKIVEQSEDNYNVLNTMKEKYVKLNKKYLDLINEINIEKKKEQLKDNKLIDEYNLKYIQLKEDILSLNSENKNLKQKISELETLKSNSLNFDSLYTIFETEKLRHINEVKNLSKLLDEYKIKYNKENEYTSKLEEENLLLKETINKNDIKPDTKSDENNNNITVEKSVEEDKTKQIKLLKDKLKHFEKKYLKYKEDYITEKNNNNLLIKEIELNESGIMEFNNQIKKLKDNLVIENEKTTKLTQDKILDQKNIECLMNERDLMQAFIKEYKDKVFNLEQMQNNYKLEIEKTTEYLKVVQLTITDQENKLLNLTSNNKIDLSIKNLEETQSLLDQKTKILDEYKEENIKLKVKLEEYDAIIKNKKESNNQKEDNKSMKLNNDIEDIKEENNRLKQKVKCTVCSKNYKNIIITKCFHTFCRECINKNLSSRQRQCPYCRVKFGEADIKGFWLNY